MLLALSRISSSFDFLSLLARQSNAEQQTIEKMVAAASPDQRNVMRSEAETALTQINKRMGQRLLFHEENKAAERAIELLVRVEAIEKGKGWWFRSKRRLQIRQMYLGGAAPKPFSAIVKNEVNDDAVKLMRLTDLAVTKYLSMSDEELMAVLPLDFPSEHYGFDLDAVTFVFPDMSDFYVTLSENTGSKSLCVTGRRRYAGFTLFVPNDGYWHCSAREGITHSATGGAKSLAQLLEKKFGIRDISSALGL
jgi:hypothetical protein